MPQGGPEQDWLATEKRVVVIHRLHQILEPFMLRRQVRTGGGSLAARGRKGALGLPMACN